MRLIRSITFFVFANSISYAVLSAPTQEELDSKDAHDFHSVYGRWPSELRIEKQFILTNAKINQISDNLISNFPLYEAGSFAAQLQLTKQQQTQAEVEKLRKRSDELKQQLKEIYGTDWDARERGLTVIANLARVAEVTARPEAVSSIGVKFEKNSSKLDVIEDQQGKQILNTILHGENISLAHRGQADDIKTRYSLRLSHHEEELRKSSLHYSPQNFQEAAKYLFDRTQNLNETLVAAQACEEEQSLRSYEVFWPFFGHSPETKKDAQKEFWLLVAGHPRTGNRFWDKFYFQTPIDFGPVIPSGTRLISLNDLKDSIKKDLLLVEELNKEKTSVVVLSDEQKKHIDDIVETWPVPERSLIAAIFLKSGIWTRSLAQNLSLASDDDIPLETKIDLITANLHRQSLAEQIRLYNWLSEDPWVARHAIVTAVADTIDKNLQLLPYPAIALDRSEAERLQNEEVIRYLDFHFSGREQEIYEAWQPHIFPKEITSFLRVNPNAPDEEVGRYIKPNIPIGDGLILLRELVMQPRNFWNHELRLTETISERLRLIPSVENASPNLEAILNSIDAADSDSEIIEIIQSFEKPISNSRDQHNRIPLARDHNDYKELFSQQLEALAAKLSVYNLSISEEISARTRLADAALNSGICPETTITILSGSNRPDRSLTNDEKSLALASFNPIIQKLNDRIEAEAYESSKRTQLAERIRRRVQKREPLFLAASNRAQSFADQVRQNAIKQQEHFESLSKKILKFRESLLSPATIGSRK